MSGILQFVSAWQRKAGRVGNKITLFSCNNIEKITIASLRKHSFQDNQDPLATYSCGWTSIDNPLDSLWVESTPFKGEYICFSLRIERRKIPVAVIHKCFAEELLKEKIATGKKYVSSLRKLELKNELKETLLQKMEWTPTIINVAIHKITNRVLFASNAPNHIEQFVALFQKSFGIELIKFNISGIQNILREIFEKSIVFPYRSYEYIIKSTGKLTLSRPGDSSIIKIENEDKNAHLALKSGFSIKTLSCDIVRDDGQTWSICINSDCTFPKIVIHPSGEQLHSKDEQLQRKLNLLSEVVDVFLNLDNRL